MYVLINLQFISSWFEKNFISAWVLDLQFDHELMHSHHFVPFKSPSVFQNSLLLCPWGHQFFTFWILVFGFWFSDEYHNHQQLFLPMVFPQIFPKCLLWVNHICWTPRDYPCPACINDSTQVVGGGWQYEPSLTETWKRPTDGSGDRTRKAHKWENMDCSFRKSCPEPGGGGAHL